MRRCVERTLRVLCKGAAASLSARPKLRGLKVFPAILDSRVSAACSLLSTPCRAVGVGAVRHHRDLCCCHTWLYSDESRQQDASSRTPPLDASWERGRPFRLRSHAASSSARTCDAVPTFGSPQVCGPRGRIPPTLTRSSERLGHGFSPRFCRRAPKAREASKGGARQAAPVGTRRAGNVGAGLPGLAALWAVGSRDEIGPPLFPAPSRAPAAARHTRGMPHTLHFFPTAVEAQLPSLIRPPAALLQLLEHETWLKVRDGSRSRRLIFARCAAQGCCARCHGRHHQGFKDMCARH